MIMTVFAGASGSIQVVTAAICGTTSALLSVWGLVLLVGRCEVVEVSPRLKPSAHVGMFSPHDHDAALQLKYV